MYAAVGVPLGRLADRSNRSRILAVGVFFWSLMTAASGLTRNFWQLFVVRLGVGVGEASCAPASASLMAARTGIVGSARPAECISIRGFGKQLVRREPFLQAIQIMVRAAAFVDESVRAHLEDVKFRLALLFSVEREQFDRPRDRHRVVGRDRNGPRHPDR
jgi:hypothetical protein